MSPLSLQEVTQHLSTDLPQWSLVEAKPAIQRRFKFTNYYETMAFVNAIAWLAHQSNHHPDLEVSYQSCLVTYTTHDANGVTLKDIQCAQQVEKLEEL
jgi:4a-hydroxytetrahydrobiopterin dehydratase